MVKFDEKGQLFSTNARLKSKYLYLKKEFRIFLVYD